MTLNLTPKVEAEIVAAAQREGIDPSSLVEQLVIEFLPSRIAKEREYQRRANLVREIMSDSDELGLYR
jgi:hypothetical protein